ncbi:diguanylate cyclase [Vibrio sp. SM6]|uniref:diguanylate cyclase n=1 Tax=Vibrio agarilyticus TaxID=2726741 RepID=A0A7X8TSU0_9VIBR|nr:GGDEF domain-containing protein [Vibrio agarilyticus]NLS14149.1 diguanylate cyclase [Vibrio agarilyticus]
MGIMESDLLAQIHRLNAQLNTLRDEHRDNSLQNHRELRILRRILRALLDNHQRIDSQLLSELQALQSALDNNQSVSTLIPQLALVEKKLRQHRQVMEHQQQALDKQIQQGADTLHRITGLPAQLKRELQALLAIADHDSISRATRLLALYERAVKIVTLNADIDFSDSEKKETVNQRLTFFIEELQNLITELDFDGESGDLLMDVRTKLLGGVTCEEVIELTVQVLKLVITGTYSERKASEQFLNTLNTSLASNLKTMEQNVEQNQNYLAHRHELNQDFSHLIDKSHSAMSQARDLDKLKADLTPLFNQMSSLSQRLKLVEEREQTLQDRLIHSKNQLESMYETTQDYRRRLDEQNKRLLKDPLTNVYNRSAFFERLEHEYRRWIRAQHNLRVVLLDIDNFRAVNENYGYVAGDKALKVIARCISKETDDTDTIARFNGEEFAILLPERDDADAKALIQRVQEEVKKLPFKFRDQQITITLTGVSTRFLDSDNPERLIGRLLRLLGETKKHSNDKLAWCD